MGKTLTTEQMAEWEEWVASRPVAVQRCARLVPPFKGYILTTTRQRAQPQAYSEDGTIRALCWQEWCPELTAVSVFGLSPDDFQEISTDG